MTTLVTERHLVLAAAEEVEERERIRPTIPPLRDFIPWLSPRYARPDHLAPLTRALDLVLDRPQRAVVTTPPRHGKTETLLHSIARTLKVDPTRTLGYVTYAGDLSRSKSRRARFLAEEAGVSLAADMANLDEWRTPRGGGVLATGVGGPLTGQGLDVLIVDDPVKNRVEAESALLRERTWQWFNDVAFTRMEPGASAIVVMARWHPDDLAGRLIEQGWPEIRLPALSDFGEPLWPERWPAVELEKIRAQVGEYTWASLYQGQPRPRGGAVFRDATYYDVLPDYGYRIGIGADFAYTAKTRADYSVAILGRAYQDRLYIQDVRRHQVEAPQFAAVLAPMQESTGADVTAIIGGTEKGTVDFLRNQGLHIIARPATGDKFVRSQPVAAAWNEGRVLLPAGAHWVEDFLSEVLGFTGVNDVHDDQVDALAALWLAVMGGRSLEPLDGDTAALLLGFTGR